MEEKKIGSEDCVREEKSQHCGRTVGGTKPFRTERQAKAWNTLEKGGTWDTAPSTTASSSLWPLSS